MLPRTNIIRTDQCDYLLFSTRDAITSKIYDSGDYAPFARNLTKGYCEGLHSPLVLDIGANLGVYCLTVGKELQKAGGAVFAYEPQRVTFYQLCGNIILNRLDNIFAYQYAIGDRHEWIHLPELDYDKSTNTSGFSIDPAIRNRVGVVVETVSTYEVEMRALGDLNLPKEPTVIKIDVEGFELDILRGAGEFLKECRYPLLIIEAWRDDWMAEKRESLLYLLADRGYQCVCLDDEVIASHPDNPIKHEFSLTENNMLRMRRRG